VSETFIFAPKIPVATFLFSFALNSSQNFSYSGMAVSGFAAFMYDGRLPFLVDAYPMTNPSIFS